MKKISTRLLQKLILITSTLFLCACGGTDSTPSEKVETDPVTATISFIELNDLHAHLVPHAEQVRVNNKILLSKRGGLARIKTKIDALKDTNTFVMNIGDTYHGGAEALFSNGNDIVSLVNELPIDVGVIGNWDYGYGSAATMARFANTSDTKVLRPNFEYICANAKYSVPLGISENPDLSDTQKQLAITTLEKIYKFKVGDNFLNPTKMIEKSGVKIGFIGLTSDIVSKMSPLLAPMLEFTQGKENYIELIHRYSASLKAQGAVMVVVMSELGIHKDIELANAIDADSVQIFFSAHTHETTFEMIETASGAKVVESGNDSYLGEMKVAIVEGKVSSYSWKLHEITDDIIPDTQLLAKVALTRQKYLEDNVSMLTEAIEPNLEEAGLNILEMKMAEQMFQFSVPPISLDLPLDHHVGKTSLALTRKNVLESGFNSVFAQLLSKIYHTDIALVPGFRYDDPIIPSVQDYTGVNTYDWTQEENVVLDGNITVENIYRFLPSTNYVAKAKVSGMHLKQFIENELTSVLSKDAFNHAGGWIPGFSGLKMQIDMRQEDGSKLLSLSNSEGVAIDGATALSVSSACARPVEPTLELASTTLCGQSLFSEVIQEEITTAEFLIQAFSSDLDENLSDERAVEDLSSELLWPQSEFVQPILK